MAFITDDQCLSVRHRKTQQITTKLNYKHKLDVTIHSAILVLVVKVNASLEASKHSLFIKRLSEGSGRDP